jgi:hypothetical protein
MPTIVSGFTLIERAVLNAICEMCATDRIALEAHLATSTILDRRNTGAGFFTDFVVQQASSAAIGGERLRAGPTAQIDGLEHGMGFILWLKDGYANCLEGYSYEESTVEIAFERVSFEILRG